MTDTDPIKQIEDEKTLNDLGKMGFFVYKGAIAEGATMTEAFRVTAAWFRGMVGGIKDDNEDEDE